MGKGAAAVYVGDQQAGGIAMQGHAHVDHITVRQIDLGRRARAFDHHHVVLGAQIVQGLGNHRPDAGTAPAPGHARQRLVDLAHEDDLAVGVVLGFQKQGVHAHIGHGACRQRLEVLGTADLSPVARRLRVAP